MTELLPPIHAHMSQIHTRMSHEVVSDDNFRATNEVRVDADVGPAAWVEQNFLDPLVQGASLQQNDAICSQRMQIRLTRYTCETPGVLKRKAPLVHIGTYLSCSHPVDTCRFQT